MRVLFVHSRYQSRGGEDVMVDQERALLLDRGHQVEVVEFDNREITGLVERVRAAGCASYSWSARRRVRQRLRAFGADLLHAHNLFPLASPSVYDAAREVGVPVVQTVHNYRMACMGGLAVRNGAPCRACSGGRPLPGIRSRCYRGSFLGSVASAATIVLHDRVGTWRRKVDRFFAPSEHVARWLEGIGIDEEKVRVKPNFVYTPPGPPRGEGAPEGAALFVGRLCAEKGVPLLLETWRRYGATLPPLWIAGDGPLRGDVEAASSMRVTYLGRLSRRDLGARIRRSGCVVVPSMVEETFGLVAVEAMACGVPVVATRSGALPEVVGEGGILVDPEDVAGLAAGVRESLARRTHLGKSARRRYERRYSPDAVYPVLMDAYRDVLSTAPGGLREGS